MGQDHPNRQRKDGRRPAWSKKTLVSLLGRSRAARTGAAQATSVVGVSVRESGNSGLNTSTSLGDSLDSVGPESSLRLTAPFVASIIGGQGLITISEGIRIVNRIKGTLDAADKGKTLFQITNPDDGFLQNVSLDGLRLASAPFANAAWPSNLQWIESWPNPTADNRSGSQEPMPNDHKNSAAQHDFPGILKLAADACVRIRNEPEQVVHLEESNTETSVTGAFIRLPRDRLGLFKPTDVSFTIDDASGGYAGGTVVLAIRGSRTWMDWMVNFNYDMVDAEGLTGIPGLKAHAGLYAVASLMRQRILDALKSHTGFPQRQIDGKKPRLVFTGHSAGGAVAALLWSCCVGNKWLNQQAGFASIHCITFGAPPITSEPLAAFPRRSPADEQDMIVSIINEGDPVPRADIAYFETLFHLYANSKHKVNDFLKEEGCLLCRLPPMSLHVCANIIGLRLIAPDTELDDLPPQIRAVNLSQTIVEKTLAGNPFAHSMAVYASNVAAYLNQDRPSLEAKIFTTRNMNFIGYGTSSPESEAAGPQFRGFKEWYLSSDLERQEDWLVVGVEDHCWCRVGQFSIREP